MPKVRDLLVHVDVEVAERKRKCHRKSSQHAILKGEPCLVVKGGPYNAGKNYCRVCAGEILRTLDRRVTAIRNALGSNTPP